MLIQYIDDFDVCGPAALLDDLLKVQLPRCGCKAKVGELEWPGEASSSTSEFLGRKKILVEDAVVTLPNEKHINDILRMLGLEQAKPSPVPGKKLNLKDNTPLEGKAKEIYASCVGSATYLSQDRPDIKFACKELAKRIREPRECDMQNLKVLGRYLRGTMHVGHVTKLDEQVSPVAGIPLQGFCDSDWAGDKEDRKSSASGQVIISRRRDCRGDFSEDTARDPSYKLWRSGGQSLNSARPGPGVRQESRCGGLRDVNRRSETVLRQQCSHPSC